MSSIIKIFAIVIFISGLNSSYSQTSFSVKLTTLSFNTNENTGFPKSGLQFDKKGKFAFEPGVAVSWESVFWDLPLSIRVTQIIGLEKNIKIAGATQLKLHWNVFSRWKSAINVSAGPGLYYREKFNPSSETETPDYNDINGNFELSDYYISAGIEYNYKINKSSDISISLNHYLQNNGHLMFGFKRWIDRKKRPRRSYRCKTCPTWS